MQLVVVGGTPPLGSPWDAARMATQDRVRHHGSTLTTGAPA